MHDLTLTEVAIIVAALAGAALVSKLVGHVASRPLCRVARIHARDTAKRAHAADLVRLPITLALTLALWQLALVFVDLPADARETLHDVARVGFVLVLVWTALRVADLVTEAMASRSEFLATHAGTRALLPLARRVVKLLVVAIAVVALLGSLGYSVTGLVAGLGITGIAVALAAQKTLENVLGAFAIGIDQPLREGDLVRVDQTIGTVEQIGLRSTRVRTPDRTLVAYPNGKLADSVIERYSARDGTRFDVRFRVALGATADQLRSARDDIHALLAGHAMRGAQAPSVHVTGLGDSWFDLQATAWFKPADWEEFQAIRDQLLFDCLDILARSGARLVGAPTPAPSVPDDKR